MDVFHKNIEALKEYRSNFYEIFRDKKTENAASDLIIDIMETKNGDSTLHVKKGCTDIRLNSSYSPKEEARRWAKNLEFLNMNTVIEMFGLGNGVFCKELLQKIKKKEDTIIIYEPEYEIFDFCLRHVDLTEIISSPNVVLFVDGINEEMIKETLPVFVNWYNVGHQVQLIHPHYEKIAFQKYKQFMEKIQYMNEMVALNENTDAFLGKSVIQNVFHNIKYIPNCSIVADLKDIIPKEIPAIIVAAGPSLKKNVQELKKAKGKSVILAVDSALTYLEEQGINPDFTITIDPQKGLEHFSVNYVRELPLIAKLEANPLIFDLNKSHKILSTSHSYMNKIYKSAGIDFIGYHSGGSVATGAFSICREIGFKHIILVGQDLAYAGEESHVGSNRKDSMENFRLREVEGIDGKMVLTRPDWHMFLNWFEKSIKDSKEIEVIDATEGGAKINGTKIMDFKDAIDLYCKETFSVEDALNNMKPTLDYKKQQRVYDFLKRDYDDLDMIIKKTRDILGRLNEVINIYKVKGVNNEVSRMTSKITDISKRIEETNIYSILDTYMSDFSKNNMMDIYRFDTDEDDTLNTFLLSRQMYQVMLDSALELKPQIRGGLEGFAENMTENN